MSAEISPKSEFNISGLDFSLSGHCRTKLYDFEEWLEYRSFKIKSLHSDSI